MLCHWLAAVPPRAKPSIRALPLVRSIPSLPASGTSYWSASCRRKDTKYFVTSRKYLLHICSSSSRYTTIFPCSLSLSYQISPHVIWPHSPTYGRNLDTLYCILCIIYVGIIKFFFSSDVCSWLRCFLCCHVSSCPLS